MTRVSGDIVPVHAQVTRILADGTAPADLDLRMQGRQHRGDEFGIVPWLHEPLTMDAQDDLDEGWKRKATAEVAEKEQWRDRDVQTFRELVSNDESVQCPTTDDFLLKFLRAQKFDYDRALVMLTRYFRMRKCNPENFDKALPSLAKSIFSHQQQTVLPCRDRNGRRIFLFRAGIWDPYQVTPGDIFAANYLLLEMIAREAKSQVAGLVMVVDLAGFCFSHIMNVSKDHVRSVANIIQNTFPLRFREIHIVNESYLFDIVFALIKPFLSETIRSRIKFHGSNMESLHDSISPSVLPLEFGGQAGPMDNSKLVDTLLEHEAFFQDLNEYGFVSDVEKESPKSHPYQGYCLASPAEEPSFVQSSNIPSEMEVAKAKIARPDQPRGNDPGWYLELKEDIESFGQGNSISQEFFEYCLAAFTEPKHLNNRSFPLGSSNSKLNHSAVTFRELPKAPPMTSTRTGLEQELKAIWAKKDEKLEISPIKLESNILGLSNVTLRSLEDDSFEPFDYTKFDLSLDFQSKSTAEIFNRRCEDATSSSTTVSLKAESVYNKTILCKYYLKGFCIHESKCSFAHGLNELKLTERDKLNKSHSKFKAEPCRNVYDSKFCQFGPKCIFAHSIGELQNPDNFKRLPCKYWGRRRDCHLADNCFYAHGRFQNHHHYKAFQK
ncbi:hypothetical protein TCAL_04745 [Tigriopus californicus]|uniref:Uncharacterized protein n=3 Tax=Tigriopus californicus TaxID=6832 RepID=A0A553P3X1_TIGCA|nr:hypothetical protein TCAL_04745 [Tigriopus californicus]